MYKKVSFEKNKNEGHFGSLIQNWPLGIPVVPEPYSGMHVPFACETILKWLDDCQLNKMFHLIAVISFLHRNGTK